MVLKLQHPSKLQWNFISSLFHSIERKSEWKRAKLIHQSSHNAFHQSPDTNLNNGCLCVRSMLITFHSHFSFIISSVRIHFFLHRVYLMLNLKFPISFQSWFYHHNEWWFKIKMDQQFAKHYSHTHTHLHIHWF